MIPKILAGEKTIESRWLSRRSAPWGTVQAGETIYFKNSGEKVSLKAKIKNVLVFDNLDPFRVAEILKKYSVPDGIQKENLASFYQRFKDKKYCLLIFLTDARPVTPFRIDKKGYGSLTAWVSCPKVAALIC